MIGRVCVSGENSNQILPTKSLYPAEYAAWNQMKTRCYNSKRAGWMNWGGRGIRVCDGWRNSFPVFFYHVGVRPSPKHSLDRFPDNDGNYEPGNVRWATRDQQTHNSRTVINLTFEGLTMTQSEWARARLIPLSTIRTRIKSGMLIADVLSPVKFRPDRSGQNNGNASLTVDEANAIILDSRSSAAEAARQYGVTETLISDIRHGKLWRTLYRPAGLRYPDGRTKRHLLKQAASR